MRNIAQYPITAEEVRQHLKQLTALPEDPRDLRIGGVDGVIWNAILRTLDVQIDKDMTIMDLVLEEANV